MDAAITAFAPRRPESTADASPSVASDANRFLSVTATYLLSEEGRKASLLSGGNGRAQQKVAVHVPSNRLHLVTVDANGVAHLTLRPRFELKDDQRVIRIDEAPTYDVPPGIEDLLREAARNHQLEQTFKIQHSVGKGTRREKENERRAELAKAFLADPKQRALANPAPTPESCYLASDHGPVAFHAKSDQVPAREVPAEAHRRFRSDVRAREQQNREHRAADLAVYEERKRLIAEWIAVHGTPEQQARQSAGMLPMQEAIEAMVDDAFAVLADRSRYVHDGVGRLQAHLRQFPEYAGVTVHRSQLLVSNEDAANATAAQFAALQEMRSLASGATVKLRVHRFGLKGKASVPPLRVWAILVTEQRGPFKLRREYLAPDGTGGVIQRTS